VRCLAPFGLGNEAPVFCARGLTVASSRMIGRTRAHRRLVVRDGAGRQQEVLWWYSADQSPPEGTFDLAFRVGVNRFRGEERVQLTWADARALEAPAVQAEVKPLTAVRDVRYLAERPAFERVAALEALVAESQRTSCVWGEGAPGEVKPAGVQIDDRQALRPAERLVVWTAPPSVDEWEEALATVAPQEVVLVCLDPGMDVPRAFLKRLAALCNYTVRAYGGQTALSTLAAATAQSEWAVRLGLQWLAARGQLSFQVAGSRVRLGPAEEGGQGTDRERIEGLLAAELQETAAYRAYLRTANAQRLVNGDALEGR
jgi:hypothetical protein